MTDPHRGARPLLSTASERASIWIEGTPRLHATVWHPERHETVFLVHGASQHAGYWNRLVPLLHEYRVVALDLRGHGRSGWASEGAYGIEDYAGDLARAVDSVLGGGARRLALVGHSMGALASMVYASRHSDRLWATVFIDIDPRPPDRQHERLHAAGQRPARVFASLGEVEAGIDRLTPGLPGAVVAMLAAQGFTQTEGGYTQRMDQRTLAEFPQVDNRPLLPSISVPAMVVRGDKSMVSSLDGATEAAASLPQGRLVLVDGEHQVHIQHPEALAAVLTPFLGASAH